MQYSFYWLESRRVFNRRVFNFLKIHKQKCFYLVVWAAFFWTEKHLLSEEQNSKTALPLLYEQQNIRTEEKRCSSVLLFSSAALLCFVFLWRIKTKEEVFFCSAVFFCCFSLLCFSLKNSEKRREQKRRSAVFFCCFALARPRKEFREEGLFFLLLLFSSAAFLCFAFLWRIQKKEDKRRA